MPAAVCPSFHCRPSTTSTLLLPSLSIRQTPTTLTNDFGSAPTVSSEKSTFRDCAAPAYVSSAARPTQAAAIVTVRLLVIMIDLRLSWLSWLTSVFDELWGDLRRAAAPPPCDGDQERKAAEEPGEGGRCVGEQRVARGLLAG